MGLMAVKSSEVTELGVTKFVLHGVSHTLILIVDKRNRSF